MRAAKLQPCCLPDDHSTKTIWVAFQTGHLHLPNVVAHILEAQIFEDFPQGSSRLIGVDFA